MSLALNNGPVYLFAWFKHFENENIDLREFDTL